MSKKLAIVYLAILFLLFASITIFSIAQPNLLSNFNQNSCYLSFNSQVNIEKMPIKGVVSEDQMVGYWTLNEKFGSEVTDLSQSNNTGIVFGAQSVDGKFGQALSFNGVNQWVNISNPQNVNFKTQSFSITQWIKFTTQGPKENIPLRRESILPRNLAGFNIVGNNLKFELYDSKIEGSFSQQYKATPSINLADGQWHFVAGVRDGDKIYLYADGVLVGSQLGVINFNFTGSSLLSLGSYTTGNGGFFSGAVDEIHIYNRALTENELSLLFKIGETYLFSNYYNFSDQTENKTMLLYMQNSAVDDNFSFIECTNFFKNNLLSFVTNNTCTINVWTKPWTTFLHKWGLE